jgi:RNA polymerase sigma factor (sigma-70 family)
MTPEATNKTKLKSFFSNEYNALRNYVKRRIDDAADREADDILQDVALKMFARADNISPITNVAAFVYNSIRNKIIDTFRTTKKRMNYDDQFEAIAQDFSDLLYSGSDNSYSELMQNELKSAVSKLKPKYREIIIAVDFEGYSYNELSEEWKVPIGTLLSRRHRALAILIKHFQKFKK